MEAEATALSVASESAEHNELAEAVAVENSIQAEPINNVIPMQAAKVEKVEAKAAVKEDVKEESKTKAAAATGGAVEETIRVSLGRLEKLSNIVGELVILQSVLNQHKEEFRNPLTLKSLSQLSKLSKEIHNMSMSLRMIPLRPTLQKMQRIVRDTSKTLDKKVNLHLVGEDTEVDKTVLEYLNDPLVHIVRNAVDHGLESTEGRKEAGKSEAGNVSINCYHEGNNLIIEITDDGKGIDADIIKRKAIEKGVLNPNANKTKEELIQLIFHPGFSTKAEVSEVSGRGVGMDVVKTNIEKVGGTIVVHTEVGKGSIFKIELPLTMAIIDGMITLVNEERYVFPLSQIHETLKPEADAVKYVTNLGEVLNLRGESLPLFRMHDLLKRKAKHVEATKYIAIIVKSKDSTFAILVDDILHQQQVVIKKLGEEIISKKGFMGSSILGDGMPALILDLHQMVAEKVQDFNTKKTNSKIKEVA